MAPPTAGTTTFLFTDIEGSTRRWEAHGEAMRAALPRHDTAITGAVEAGGGRVFKHTGDGICAAFGSAGDAVLAAVEAQRRLTAETWAGLPDGVTVRMGVHTGDAEQRDDDFFGPVLNRTARIMGVAHGGQVVVSAVTAGLLADEMPDGVGITDLGAHRLRDLINIEHLHQVVADGLRADFPPLQSLDTFHHNLPVQRTSFVGRERDVADVIKRLEVAPLVTLTGVGGSGKTRLALEAAVQVLHDHADGVAFVDLAPVADGDLVETAVAAAAGLQRGASTGAAIDVGDDLIQFLAGRESLVVIDNCEHLIDDVADLVDRILGRCPVLTVLATSREALGVDGEHVVRVGALPTDGPGDDAVRLFHDRAAAADHTYDTVASAGAAADICRRLDGMPLAIELAAAQVRHLAPAEIAARLDERFDLLTGGRRRVQRQQTLEAALDWSHDLLDLAEQVVLRRLAVFAGSFDGTAAEAVVTAIDDPPASAVRRHLGALVEKSLVVSTEVDGATRFRLLETVRLYALKHLDEAAEVVAVRDGHRDHYLGVAETGDVLRRTLDLVQNARKWHEVENFRASLDWSRNQGRLDLVARQLAGTIGVYWVYGLSEEADEWSALVTEVDGLEPDVASRVCLLRGIACMMQGDLLAMPEWYEAAAERAETAAIAIDARIWLGFSLMGDERGIPILEQALADAERVAPDLTSTALFMLGADYLFASRLDEALDAFERAAVNAHPQSVEELYRVAWHAVTLSLLGRPDDSIALLDEIPDGIGAWWEYGIPWAQVIAHRELGDRTAAAEALRQGAEKLRRIGVPLATEELITAAAGIAVDDDDLPHAARLLGCVRGRRPYLALRTPASYAVYRLLRDTVFAGLAEAESRAHYDAGKDLDPMRVLRDEVARLTA